MSQRVEKISRFWWKWCLVITSMFCFAWWLLSCTPAYLPCTAVEKARWRCNDTTLEVCDGEVWHPRTDCAEVWDEDGKQVPMTCVQHGDMADCEVSDE